MSTSVPLDIVPLQLGHEAKFWLEFPESARLCSPCVLLQQEVRPQLESASAAGVLLEVSSLQMFPSSGTSVSKSGSGVVTWKFATYFIRFMASNPGPGQVLQVEN